MLRLNPEVPANQFPDLSRRKFLARMSAGGMAFGTAWSGMTTSLLRAEDSPVDASGKVIAGFETNEPAAKPDGLWKPFSDRKIRVGIAGYGLCKFGAQFGFQDHPNVEVAAVTDLIADRRAELAKACRCAQTYESCEDMLNDDSLEAVYIATDAPSHAELAITALLRGKHVASAVPAVFGSLEDADRLFEAVKKTGRHYMMFETSCFHKNLYAWHRQFDAGALGKIVYSEGEYFHYFGKPLGGYNPKTRTVDTNGWRKGLPPQWYPTHATAFYVGVTGHSFTEVSALGTPSVVPHLQPKNNQYKNPFGSEVGLFRTTEGGMSRMAVSWDMPSAHGEQGRVYGQKNEKVLVSTARPALPPGMAAGSHGGSHGHLTSEFVDAVLRNRKPWIDVAQSLNMTVAGIVAHQSALRDGETLRVPQYHMGQGRNS